MVSAEYAVCRLFRPVSVLVTLNSSKCLTWPTLFLGTMAAESFGDSLRNSFTAWICATVTLRNDSASGQRAVLPTEFVEIISPFIQLPRSESLCFASTRQGPRASCMPQMSISEVRGESSLASRQPKGKLTSDASWNHIVNW